MGFVLKYCDICNKRIPEDDLISGQALEWENRTYCREHVPAEARIPTPSRGAARGNSSIVRKGGGGGAQKISGRTATNLPAINPASLKTESGGVAPRVGTGSASLSGFSTGPNAGATTRRRSPAGMPSVSERPNQPANPLLWILGLVGGLAVLGAVAVVVLNGSSSRTPSGGTPSNTNTGGNGSGPSAGSNTKANNPGPKPDPAEQKAREAEALRIQLNKDADDNLAAWEKYKRRSESLSPQDRSTEAQQWFDQAKAILRRATDTEPPIKLDHHGDVELVLESWAREASTLSVDEARRRVRALIEAGQFAEAKALVESILDGKREEFVAKKYLPYWPGTQMKALLDEVKAAETAFNSMSEAERQALRRLEMLERRVQEYATAVREKTSSWAEGRALGQELQQLNQALGTQAGAAIRARMVAVGRTWIDQTAQWLAEEFTKVEETDAGQVAAWLDKAQWYLTVAPAELEAAIRISQIVQRLNRAAGRGGLGPVGKELESASKSTDITAIQRALMRLMSFMSQNGVSQKASAKASELILQAGRKLHGLLKDAHPKIGRGVSKEFWISRAYCFTTSLTQTNLDSLTAEIEAINALLQPLIKDGWTAVWLEAIDAYLKELYPDDAPGALGVAVWRQRYNVALVAIQTVNKGQLEMTSREGAIAQRNATWCYSDTVTRINAGVRTKAEAARLISETGMLLQSFLPDTPEMAQPRAQIGQVRDALRNRLNSYPEQISQYPDEQ